MKTRINDLVGVGRAAALAISELADDQVVINYANMAVAALDAAAARNGGTDAQHDDARQRVRRARVDAIINRDIGRTSHTSLDHAALLAAGVDPASTQPREHAVMCGTCGRSTWHQAGHCDAHYTPPAAALRTVMS